MPDILPFSSPLVGEEGARGEAVGSRGGLLLDHARDMRSAPTEAERRLWRLLRGKRLAGWKFKRQQPVEPYIVDFVCFAARLIVEADGSQHAGSDYDAARDKWLRAQGFRLLRFWNNDIVTRSEDVLTAILAALECEGPGIEPAPSPPPLPGPLPQGEREQKKVCNA